MAVSEAQTTIWPRVWDVTMVRLFSSTNTPTIDQSACRVKANNAPPNTTVIAVSCHSMMAEMPNTIAAPFPPLNFRNGEKLCPKVATTAEV